MTRDEAVNRIQVLLGFRTDLVTVIQNALLDAQVEIEMEPELPWFLQTEVAFSPTVDGEERKELPDDFIKEIDEDALWLYQAELEDDEQWTPLIKEDISLLRRKLPASGPPRAYAIDGRYFRLFPKPDGVYILKLMYFAKDDTLTTNIENRWLKYAPSILIGVAGKKVASAARDTTAHAEFADMETKGRVLLYNYTVAREEEGRRRIMGGEN